MQTHPKAPMQHDAHAPNPAARPALQQGRSLRQALGRRVGLGLLLTSLGMAGVPAAHAEGVRDMVGPPSSLLNRVPAAEVEQAAATRFAAFIAQADRDGRRLPDSDPGVVRVRQILARMIPAAQAWNERAAGWNWQVHVLTAPAPGLDASRYPFRDPMTSYGPAAAFCMAGGLIVVYAQTLKLPDDQVALVMGHEVAHAVRDHGREGLAKDQLLNAGADMVRSKAPIFTRMPGVLERGVNIAALHERRRDEVEADLIGLELAARAGYDPRAVYGMYGNPSADGRAERARLEATHPTYSQTLQALHRAMPWVLPLYEASGRKSGD